MNFKAWIFYHAGKETSMQRPSHESLTILYELDLGLHTLFIMSDGSIDLLANDDQTRSLVENGMSLDSDETYRLFISLHEQFRSTHQEVHS